ncbi:hypothetical protein Tco_0887736 [Tanacetum coccineum]
MHNSKSKSNYINEDFEGKRTIDTLMDHVPVIDLSDDDSDLPSTQKRNVNNDENVITKDDVRLISSDYEELFPCTERKLSEEDTKKMKTWYDEYDNEIPIRFKRRKNNKFNSMSKKRRMNCIYDSTDDEVAVIENATNQEVEQVFDVESKDDSQDVHGISHQTTYNLIHSEETENDFKVDYDSNDSFINDGSLGEGSSEDDNDSDI